MPLLNLTSDFVFRALFTRCKGALIDLLNCALEFEGRHRIENLTIEPAELMKDFIEDKTSILDIKAQSLEGDLFNIEMQAFGEDFYGTRALYYWAKLYTSQLTQGQSYKSLQKTYSINFLNFKLIDLPEYKSNFLILEKDHPDIQLTDKFQILFFELPKFTKRLEKIDDNLDIWLYIMKNTSILNEEQMRTIIDKSPVMKETLAELGRISIDPEMLGIEERRLKSRLDHESALISRYDRGLAEGKAEGEAKGLAKGEAKGLAKGKAEGKAEGEAKGKIETQLRAAKVMLRKGHSIHDISEITGLPLQKIEKLK